MAVTIVDGPHLSTEQDNFEPSNNPQAQQPAKTALIADDNSAIRKFLTEAFLAEGFNACNEAENGRDAIEVAERTKPDLIVLDLSMPVMNGLAAAVKLRKILPKTPIILFTSYEDSLSKADASKAGINLVVPKTVPVPTLLDQARKLMGHSF